MVPPAPIDPVLKTWDNPLGIKINATSALEESGPPPPLFEGVQTVSMEDVIRNRNKGSKISSQDEPSQDEFQETVGVALQRKRKGKKGKAAMYDLTPHLFK